MGKSERDGGTPMSIARYLLNETKLPRILWNQVTSTTTYLYNTIPHNAIGMETLYRRMFGRDAKHSHLTFMWKVIRTRHPDALGGGSLLVTT